MSPLLADFESALTAASATEDRTAARQALAAAEAIAARLVRAGADLRPYGPTLVALRTRLGVATGPVSSVVAIVDEAWEALEAATVPAGPPANRPSEGLLFEH